MMSVGFGSSTALWVFPIILGLGFGGCLTVIIVAAHFSAPPELLSISSGAMVTTRALGASVCLPVTTAIFNSQLTKYLPKDIASAVLPLGLSPDVLKQFIPALIANDNGTLATIPGATPEIIGAGVHGLQQAYITSFRALHGFGLALSAVATIGKTADSMASVVLVHQADWNAQWHSSYWIPRKTLPCTLTHRSRWRMFRNKSPRLPFDHIVAVIASAGFKLVKIALGLGGGAPQLAKEGLVVTVPQCSSEKASLSCLADFARNSRMS